MTDFVDRQKEILALAILQYKKKQIDLNSLIHKIEAVTAIISSQQWKKVIFPIILEMEQVNANIIGKQDSTLTENNKLIIEKAVIDLERLIEKMGQILKDLHEIS